MCPIVPMFTCGLLRSNFSFAISMLLIEFEVTHWQGEQHRVPDSHLPAFSLLFAPQFLSGCHSAFIAVNDLFRQVLGNLFILAEVHGKTAAALRTRAQLGCITKHF